jgi:hypothetical protein
VKTRKRRATCCSCSSQIVWPLIAMSESSAAACGAGGKSRSRAISRGSYMQHITNTRSHACNISMHAACNVDNVPCGTCDADGSDSSGATSRRSSHSLKSKHHR